LVLNKCRRITDRAIAAITRLGKNLHFIHLGHCSQITDAGLQHLVRQCNRIRYIDLACCTNLTDLSVTQLAFLPRLKRVGLVKCGNITDLSILALASPRQPQGAPSSPTTPIPSSLERVHLSYCTNLSVNGIGALLNNCPRIAHLSLTGITAFLRDELLCFCRESPPNFTEHQRENFCVFSGPGVGRLRNFLNDQAQAARTSSDPYYDRDGEDEDEDDDVEMADARALSIDNSASADSSAVRLAVPPTGFRIGVPTAMPGTMTTAYRSALPSTSAPIAPAMPPARPLSLPNAFGSSSAIPLARLPQGLPPLRIPQHAGQQRLGLGFLPDAQSPTLDQPLSLDEGEEYIKSPGVMDESEGDGPAPAVEDRNP
jgi:hypothetical protein